MQLRISSCKFWVMRQINQKVEKMKAHHLFNTQKNRITSISSGFTNQQALLVLIICFPLGLIAIGFLVILLQRPATQLPESANSSPNNGTLIPSLPAGKLPSKDLSTNQNGLSEMQARSIVEKWLSLKSQIFAPPYDTKIADTVVADGPLWTDLTKSNGSIEWLKNNNNYYSYTSIRINSVISYVASDTMPSIVVSVTENSVLHSSAGSEPSLSTNNWNYTLRKENGDWKIWDYRKQ